MACYEVSVDIKRGYVRPKGRVAVSMSLPDGAETIIDLENVYIANPTDHSISLLSPLEVSIETEENVLIALFEAEDLLNVATDDNKVVLVADFIEGEEIVPVGETESYDCLFGTATFEKTIVGPPVGHGGGSGPGSGGHGGGSGPGSGGHGGGSGPGSGGGGGCPKEGDLIEE